MKHQLDATLCRFYFCRVTLHVSGASAHHQECLKLVQRPLVHVLSLQVSHHISLLGPPALILRKAAISFIVCVCLSVSVEQLGSLWMDFHEI